VIRWAWRLFRREWRQQILVLTLLTVAVAASVFSASAAYNVAPVPGNAEFGSANHLLRFDGSDPLQLQADLGAAEEWFGTVDVITRRQVQAPGLFEPVEVRAQDPDGAFSAPMLALRAGHYPVGAGEIALTDGVAQAMSLHIGGSFVLTGVERAVVGVVENPSDLNAEFALIARMHDDRPESVTILVDASDERVFAFRRPSMIARTARGADDAALAAIGVLGATTMALLVVALVAAAGFVVVAQRRLRQLGMLAAIGATEQHLRLVTVANGVAIGVAAAVTGAVVGVVGWTASVPFLEPAFGHRIAPFDVPWWLIAAAMLLAVVTATGAAWWPARAAARRLVDARGGGAGRDRARPASDPAEPAGRAGWARRRRD